MQKNQKDKSEKVFAIIATVLVNSLIIGAALYDYFACDFRYSEGVANWVLAICIIVALLKRF